MTRILVCILLLASVSGSSPTVLRPRASSPELWARTELYFGTNKPDGTAIPEADFRGFLDSEITPRFPDGLTLVTGYGQFKNAAGAIVQERSFLLILFYPAAEESSRNIEEIRERYKRAFRQESVLRVDSGSFVSF